MDKAFSSELKIHMNGVDVTCAAMDGVGMGADRQTVEANTYCSTVVEEALGLPEGTDATINFRFNETILRELYPYSRTSEEVDFDIYMDGIGAGKKKHSCKIRLNSFGVSAGTQSVATMPIGYKNVSKWVESVQ